MAPGQEKTNEETLTRGERTRQTILDAAEGLFLVKGYNGTSMREIAREAGDIAVGGIYNHFGSKEEIFRALLEDRSPYPHIIATLESLEAQTGPEMLSEAFARLEGVLADNLRFIGLVFIDFQEFEGSTIRQLVNTIVPHVLQFGQRLQAAGGVRDDLNLFVLVRIFAILMIGYVTTQLIAYSGDRLLLPSVPDMRDINWQTALIDVVLNGVAKQETG